jgi:hypothetical protein
MVQQSPDKLQRDDGCPDPDALLKRYNLPLLEHMGYFAA